MLNIWKKNGFQGFVRCEPFENFLKIMRSGCLKSRAKLEAEGVEFDDVAMTEVIDQTPDWVKKYVRFYFKEKTPTFYRNEGIQRNPNEKDGHNPIPVCLIFSEKLINAKGTIVSNGGLGSKASSYTESFCDALEYDWQSIFSRGPHSIESDDVNLKIKTKRDAEFLVPKSISIDFIDKIIFRCEADYNRAVFELGHNPLFSVDGSKFNLTTGIYEKRGEDRNCLMNYRVKSTVSGYHVDFVFYKNPDYYSHEVYASYHDGTVAKVPIIWHHHDEETMGFDINLGKANLDRVEYKLNGITSAVWR